MPPLSLEHKKALLAEIAPLEVRERDARIVGTLGGAHGQTRIQRYWAAWSFLDVLIKETPPADKPHELFESPTGNGDTAEEAIHALWERATNIPHNGYLMVYTRRKPLAVRFCEGQWMVDTSIKVPRRKKD